MNPKWFKDYLAYTMSKYGMSLCVLGMAAEFAEDGIAVNALWPKTVIATAALMAILKDPQVIESTTKHCRLPSIVADAAYEILLKDSRECTGHFFIDEDILRDKGVTDFSHYAVSPGNPLKEDFFFRLNINIYFNQTPYIKSSKSAHKIRGFHLVLFTNSSSLLRPYIKVINIALTVGITSTTINIISAPNRTHSKVWKKPDIIKFRWRACQ